MRFGASPASVPRARTTGRQSSAENEPRRSRRALFGKSFACSVRVLRNRLAVSYHCSALLPPDPRRRLAGPQFSGTDDIFLRDVLEVDCVNDRSPACRTDPLCITTPTSRTLLPGLIRTSNEVKMTQGRLWQKVFNSDQHLTQQAASQTCSGGGERGSSVSICNESSGKFGPSALTRARIAGPYRNKTNGVAASTSAMQPARKEAHCPESRTTGQHPTFPVGRKKRTDLVSHPVVHF